MMSEPATTPMPAWHTQSFWTGMTKLALEGAALATGLTAAEPMIAALPEAVRGRVYAGLVIAAALRFTSSLLGQLAAFFVRAGVTTVGKKAEANSERIDAVTGDTPAPVRGGEG